MSFTLITGASSGIGEVFAKEYAKKGHDLILVARSELTLNKIAKDLEKNHKIKVHVIVQDLSLRNSAEELFIQVKKLKAEVSLLINNAGFGLIGEFENQDLARVQDMLELNIVTLTKLTQLFIPQLKMNKGTILNVASRAGFQPIPYMAVYAASKAYVLHFSEALRAELETSGVKVIALCPGTTATNFFKIANSEPKSTPMSAEQVVEEAIAGIENNKAVIVPGTFNRLLHFLTRFISRAAVINTAKNRMKP